MPFNEDNLKFILGFKLKNLRLQRGYSLKDVATRANMSISYLSEIEKGKKYPKAEKLLALANCYEVGYDELVTVDGQDNLNPLAESLDSGFFQEFPFQLFGLQAADLFSLLTTSPDKAGALIRTFLEIGQMYDVRVEHFLFAALRAYQKMHNNYFEDLELAAESFLESDIWGGKPVNEINLRRYLEVNGRYIIDETLLADHPTLHSFRSVFIPGKRPRLFLNKRLLPSQKAFIFGKEIGTRLLGIETRATTSSWIKVESFEQVLNNYRTSYFAGALLIGRTKVVGGLSQLFNQKTWDPVGFLGLMKSLDSTPEMFFYRIGQLAHNYFGLSSHYFMRLAKRDSEDFIDVSKMLNLSTIPLPRGFSNSENYCRKWAGMKLLADRTWERGIAYPDLPARGGPTAQAQRSNFANTGQEVFSFAVSRAMQLSPSDDSAVILGFPMDDALKSVIRFWGDPALKDQLVGITCERCNLGPKECSERMADPSLANEMRDVEVYERALSELQTRYQS